MDPVRKRDHTEAWGCATHQLNEVILPTLGRGALSNRAGSDCRGRGIDGRLGARGPRNSSEVGIAARRTNANVVISKEVGAVRVDGYGIQSANPAFRFSNWVSILGFQATIC